MVLTVIPSITCLHDTHMYLVLPCKTDFSNTELKHSSHKAGGKSLLILENAHGPSFVLLSRLFDFTD